MLSFGMIWAERTTSMQFGWGYTVWRLQLFLWLYLSSRLQTSPTPGLLALLWAGLINKDFKLPRAFSDSSYIITQCCSWWSSARLSNSGKFSIFFFFFFFWSYYLPLCSQSPAQSPLTIHSIYLTAGCFSFEKYSVPTLILFLACEQHSYSILPGGRP